jgi:hypothetical protein
MREMPFQQQRGAEHLRNLWSASVRCLPFLWRWESPQQEPLRIMRRIVASFGHFKNLQASHGKTVQIPDLANCAHPRRGAGGFQNHHDGDQFDEFQPAT